MESFFSCARSFIAILLTNTVFSNIKVTKLIQVVDVFLRLTSPKFHGLDTK